MSNLIWTGLRIEEPHVTFPVVCGEGCHVGFGESEVEALALAAEYDARCGGTAHVSRMTMSSSTRRVEVPR